MSKYKCGVCGHLNYFHFGTNPPKSLENMPCDACSADFRGKRRIDAQVRADMVLIPDPNLTVKCGCKYCKKLKKSCL
jgi:hypothetical protein